MCTQCSLLVKNIEEGMQALLPALTIKVRVGNLYCQVGEVVFADKSSRFILNTFVRDRDFQAAALIENTCFVVRHSGVVSVANPTALLFVKPPATGDDFGFCGTFDRFSECLVFHRPAVESLLYETTYVKLIPTYKLALT